MMSDWAQRDIGKDTDWTPIASDEDRARLESLTNSPAAKPSFSTRLDALIEKLKKDEDKPQRRSPLTLRC